MHSTIRDLRYIRVSVLSLADAVCYGGDILGLQIESATETAAYFRSDQRNYSLCYTSEPGAALALTVASREDLEAFRERLAAIGYEGKPLIGEEALQRQIKEGLAVVAPNGVTIELVWRPMTAGWPFHGPRLTGITGFQSVQLACTDVAANEAFFIKGLGLRAADWVGDAVFLGLDDAHHRIALYPSAEDGLLGATWEVDSINALMRNWYFLQAGQLPVVQGPGRQPSSGAMFVTTRGAGDILYSYATAMAEGPDVASRPPRQFPDVALSHCAWGSISRQAEFKGRIES